MGFLSSIGSSIGTWLLEYLLSKGLAWIYKKSKQALKDDVTDEEVKAIEESAKQGVKEVRQAEKEGRQGRVSEETEKRLRERTRRLKDGLLGPGS